MQLRTWTAGLFACGVGLFACGTPSKTESTAPKAETPASKAPPPAVPSGPPFVVGTVRDKKTLAIVQGIDVTVRVGNGKDERTLGTAISNEHGEYRLDVELGDGALVVAYGLKADTLLEEFHAGENRIDLSIDGDVVAKDRASQPPVVCPSSKPGTFLVGHTTTQQDIDDLAHAILERGKDAVPDYPLAAAGVTTIAVIADIGHGRRLSTNALPTTGFKLADATTLQTQTNLSRQQTGFIQMNDIWSDGTCASVLVGGDIMVPDDPNIIKMCCCKASAIYEKRAGTWVFVQNAWTMCS